MSVHGGSSSLPPRVVQFLRVTIPSKPDRETSDARIPTVGKASSSWHRRLKTMAIIRSCLAISQCVRILNMKAVGMMCVNLMKPLQIGPRCTRCRLTQPDVGGGQWGEAETNKLRLRSCNVPTLARKAWKLSGKSFRSCCRLKAAMQRRQAAVEVKEVASACKWPIGGVVPNSRR